MNQAEWARHVKASLTLRGESLGHAAEAIGYTLGHVAKVVYSGYRYPRVIGRLSDYLGLAYPEDMYGLEELFYGEGEDDNGRDQTAGV